MKQKYKYADKNYYSPIPCPNCGSKVKITSSRDCNILSTYAECLDILECQGMYFCIDSEASPDKKEGLLQSDKEIVAIKYYHWASKKQRIKGYRCKGEWD